MKNLVVRLLCLGFLGLIPAAASIIYVSGDQTGTWSADTVIVTGEVRVPPNQSLTIQPGVEVYFWAYCKFIVDSNATLTAVGTSADTILFNEHWMMATNGWHGIRFLAASSNSRLEYCHLTNGYAQGNDADGGAIYCYQSSLTIAHCLIDSCIATANGGAICCNSLSSAYIDSNTISGNSAGSYGGGGGIFCYDNSNPTISSNTINGNSAYDGGGGIECYYYSNPTISNNTINWNYGSSGGGIRCDNSSPSIINNTINWNDAYNYGGGIECYDYSNPTISSNTINGNSACYGGGIRCYDNSAPTINSNTISENFASERGCGIYCNYNSSPTISYNTIDGNYGNYCSGGGIYCYYNSNPTINGNTIIGNSVPAHGGGIYCHDSNPTISRNKINRNSAALGGGVVFNNSSSNNVEFNEISQNTASGNGGGICSENSNPSLNKNTIADNSAAQGGGIYSTASNPIFINCILWANVPDQIYQTNGSSVQATYSDIQQYWPEPSNINEDPMFADTTWHDYYLQFGSPCIDAGDPDLQYNDPDNSRADMGCYPYDSTYVAVEPESSQLQPNKFALFACYPNPFNPSTVVSFELRVASLVNLRVYDISGRLVATVVNGWREVGKHQITFDGSDLTSGIYLAELQAGEFTAVQKIVLLK